MRSFLRWAPMLVLAACGRAAAPATSPVAFALPDSTSLIDGPTGRTLPTRDLLRRIAASDFVLLGEVHDNAVDHALRGALITAFAARRPAVVFEQFADHNGPIPPPSAGDSIEAWLDRYGFDRRGWRWPMHRPVVDAAIRHARSLWGSGLSRETLRSVVYQGESAAPESLRRMMMQAPLEGVGRAVMDSELVASHCGMLPDSMVAGMRVAQVTRDAAMTRALLKARAAEAGPVWLIAGNGHVRMDLAVPRLLRSAAPDARVLVVGLLEREPNGAAPDAAERRLYDLVIVTPRATREDPCAGMRR